MLLKLFKSNQIYNFLLIPLLGMSLVAGSFLQPETIDLSTCMNHSPACFLMNSINFSVKTSIIINYIIILIISILLVQLNNKFAFIRVSTLLPAPIFMMIILGIPNLRIIQPVFFASLLLILAIGKIFSGFNKKSAIRNAFDASFLLGIASLFYPLILFLTILIPFSLYILNNRVKTQTIFTTILGALLPWIYVFAGFFIFGSVETLLTMLDTALNTSKSYILGNTPLQVFLSYFAFLTIVASFFMLNQYDEKKISSRRYFKVLFLFFISSSILLPFPPVSFEIIVILAIPLCFLLTNYLLFMKKRFWAEVFFTLMFVLSLSIQIFI